MSHTDCLPALHRLALQLRRTALEIVACREACGGRRGDAPMTEHWLRDALADLASDEIAHDAAVALADIMGPRAPRPASAIMGPSDLVRALADLRHFANASGFNWRDTLTQAERLVLTETPRHGAHR